MGWFASRFARKTLKARACLCLVPQRHVQGLDPKKLDRVLNAYAGLTALPVVRQFHLNAPEHYRIRTHPDSNPPSVSFIWTVPADIEEDVVRMTRECWQKIIEINDQEGIDGMLTYDAAMSEGT